jgi:uncharacterized protein HemX
MSDLDSTLIRQLEGIVERVAKPQHPVKDVVLPLAVVVGLIANALVIGVAWGRFSQRMDTYEAAQVNHTRRIEKMEEKEQAMRDRVRDLERDAKESERRFWLLDDYTRGRIDRLPYKTPAPARW